MNVRHHFYWSRFTFTAVTAGAPYATGLFLVTCLTTAIAAAHLTASAGSGRYSTPVQRTASNHSWLKLPTIRVTMARQIFILSVARTAEQQKRGLMFVHRLPANRGMIFVFRHDCRPTFWMKDTYIPLDLIYVSGAGVIRQHYTMAANGNAHHLYPSQHPIVYAIEIRAGVYHKLGLKTGQKLNFPPGFLKATPQHP